MTEEQCNTDESSTANPGGDFFIVTRQQLHGLLGGNYSDESAATLASGLLDALEGGY